MAPNPDPMAPAGAQQPAARVRFGRLQNAAPLGLHMDACLAVRSRYSDCRSCEAICPARVLRVDPGEGLSLGEGCLGCGRCAAACPTGALAVPGLGAGNVSSRGGRVVLDCWKVPRGEAPEGGRRVPCLGGLSVTHLLELRAEAHDREIVLLDRGWCANCSAGCREAHPAARAVDRANALLEEAGVPPHLLITIGSARLPASRMPERIPEADQEQGISRRAFFSSLAGRVSTTVNDIVQIVPVADEEAHGPDRRSPIRSYARERTLKAIQSIACHWRHPMPRSLFNTLVVSSLCRDHRVCAATCPTGALHRYASEGERGLDFDAWRCIGCGHCESVCPEGAVRLGRGAATEIPGAEIRLTRFGQANCAECGCSFSVMEGEDEMHCMNCRKRRGLARSAFQQLFGGTRH